MAIPDGGRGVDIKRVWWRSPRWGTGCGHYTGLVAIPDGGRGVDGGLDITGLVAIPDGGRGVDIIRVWWQSQMGDGVWTLYESGGNPRWGTGCGHYTGLVAIPVGGRGVDIIRTSQIYIKRVWWRSQAIPDGGRGVDIIRVWWRSQMGDGVWTGLVAIP